MQIVWIIYFIGFATPSSSNVPLYPELTNEILSTTNELCRNESELFKKALDNNLLWAFQMWDSSQKDVIGISPGMTYQLGHYDECVSINDPIKAKYCLVNVRLIINYTITDPYNLIFKPRESFYEKIQNTNDPNKIKRNIAHIGICVPNSCSSKDVNNYLQKYLVEKNEDINTYYEISTVESNCNKRIDGINFDFFDVMFCITVVMIVLTVIICTAIDFKNSQQSTEVTKVDKYISCFSIFKNIDDLKRKETNDALNIFYGMKVFLMVCVIMGHTMITALTGPVYNFDKTEMFNRDVANMMLCKGDVIVDIFFLFGGLLVTYGFFVQSEKKVVNPFKSILLRYFRIMPIFAFLTFFYATIYDKLGSGPLWNESVGNEAKNCQKNWWINLLFLNNYINIDNMCIIQAWYLPCDFHLFILSIPLNNLLKRNEKGGLIILGILLGLSILSPFLITYISVKEPFVFLFNDYFKTLRQNNTFQKVYVPTHTRASTYLIGMFFGYIYYKIKDKKFQITTLTSFVLISLSLLIGFICILSAGFFYNPYREYSSFESALYASVHRPIFTIFSGVLIFCVSYSTFPYFRDFFGYHHMIPLGKLSFGAYMTHMLFQYIRVGTAKTPMDISLTSFNWISFIHLDLSFALITSFLLFIFIENPLIRFLKLLLPPDRTRKISCVSYENSVTINTQI